MSAPNDRDRRAELEEIRRTFTEHPLSEASILERLREQGADFEHLRETDLAEDPQAGITDQNHIGGCALALALGARAGIRAGMRVLDLCAGLGGTGRVLADTLGCRVVGLEVTPARCRDAVSLSRRVGLESSVAFVEGDARALPFAAGSFDAVVGQSSWSHIADKRRLLAEAGRVLRPGGVVAFEDAVLGPRQAAHADCLAELSRYWCFHLADVAVWRAALESNRFRVQAVESLDHELLQAAWRMLDQFDRQYFSEAAEHRRHWVDVARLVESGALGYARFIASLSAGG